MKNFHSLCQNHGILLALALTAVVALKLATILVFASHTLGDNAEMIESARQILDGRAWLPGIDLAREPLPATLWRPIGYSMILSAMMTLFGGAWPYAICVLQCLFSLVAGLMVLRLCLVAELGMPWSVAVFLLYQWSTPLSTDALVMEDALTGAVGSIALTLMLIELVRGRIPSLALFFGAGLSAGFAFLIRDVYHFVMPIVAVAVFILLLRLQGVVRAGLAAAALVLPVVVATFVLQTWNQHRIGYAITTTSGQTGYIYAVLRAAQYDLSIIDGDGRLETALREVAAPGYNYVEVKAANHLLFNRGVNSVEQAREAGRLFWRTLFSHPLPYLKAALDRVRIVQQGTLFAGPITRWDDLDWWAGGATEEGFRTGWRAEVQEFQASHKLSALSFSAVVNIAIRGLTRAFGLVGLAVFVIGTPLLWLRQRRELGGAADAALAAWALYGLWFALFVPVCFEVRYLSPVIGCALFAAALVATRLRRRVEAAADTNGAA